MEADDDAARPEVADGRLRLGADHARLRSVRAGQAELDKLPPAYARDVYQRNCDLAYQHVYDAYFGEGRSVYASAA